MLVVRILVEFDEFVKALGDAILQEDTEDDLRTSFKLYDKDNSGL